MASRDEIGLIAEIGRMQREENEIRAGLTPEQRAERSKAQLEQIPGQAYLFEPERKSRKQRRTQ